MHINREELKKKNQDTQVNETLSSEVSSISASSKTVSKNSSHEKYEKAILVPKNKEEQNVRKKLPTKYIWLIVLLAVILAASCIKIYSDNSYKPQNQGKEIDASILNIKKTDNMLVVRNPKLGETKHKIGIIFYQDNRIEGECYLPIMKKLALLGYDCFLPVAFGNQAFLNVDGADSVIRKYESIKKWILVGHGGSCRFISEYASENPDKTDGVIFLGGYSGNDLSDLSLAALSIIGSDDSVINNTKYENAKSLLPKDAEYKILNGGNHSGFADTTLISGDSKGSLSFDQQTDKSVKFIHSFIQNQIDN